MLERLDLGIVQDLLDKSYLTKRSHPELPLHVLTYTSKVQAEGYWTEYTNACRGLVTDDEGNIISRPFPKFHHWDQVELPPGPPIAYDKMDGSLIVVSSYQGRRIVNSRTSFTSDHAAVAEELLEEWQPFPGYTYCFELIHPEMRIVCDYGDEAKLVLLARITTWSGAELPVEWTADWKGEIVPRRDISWPWNHPDDYAQGNSEGFVLHWPNADVRVKAKFSDYIRLHGLLTGVNTKRIWELLSTGRSTRDYKENVPDEFLSWVEEQERELLDDFSTSLVHLRLQFQELMKEQPDRKTFALAVKDLPQRGILFHMYDGKDPDRLIWKMLEPEGSRPYWNRE